MADIAAGDVTYTVKNLRNLGNSKKHNRIQLVFGDGALTVPAGGIPLTKGKLGCPNTIESLIVVAQGTSGYQFQYVPSTEKLVVMQAPAQTHTHDLLLKDAAVADGATTRVNAGANLLGANTGGDLTVTGGGANGGVVSTTLAAAALSQASTVAIAAQTIEVEVIGW